MRDMKVSEEARENVSDSFGRHIHGGVHQIKSVNPLSNPTLVQCILGSSNNAQPQPGPPVGLYTEPSG